MFEFAGFDSGVNVTTALNYTLRIAIQPAAEHNPHIYHHHLHALCCTEVCALVFIT